MNEIHKTLAPGNESPAATASESAVLDYDRAVEQFYEPLYKFAFVLAGNESDAADLTQETYQVLLVKGGQIRDGQKLKSWLFTTLYRKFLGQRRRNTRFPEVQVEAVEWELPAIDAETEESVDANTVVAALQMLDEKYRTPLVLFYLQDLSYREIAAALDLPVGTIMSRLSRGKEILRKRLEADELSGLAGHHGYRSKTGKADTAAAGPNALSREMHWQFGGIAACC